jgi:hypothetical protein
VIESNLTELATEAYLYYYPLVENLRQVQRYVDTGIGSNPAAAFNSFSHARNLAGPQDTFVTINNDTVYSMAQLDLSIGPLRLEVPDTGERYYVLQFVDAWTNNIAYVGTRATGNRTGRFLITPPGWDGELPDGHTHIPASTTIVSIVGRFACAGPEDIPAVNAVQDAVVLTPHAADPPEPAGIPDSSGEGEELTFWDQAWSWSQTFPAPPQDDPYDQRYAPLHPPAGSDGAAHNGGTSDEVLIAGYRAGVDKLEYLTHHGQSPVINGWTVGIHAFDYNLYALGPGTLDDDEWKITDPTHRIVERAVADRLGLWGNHGYEAVYAQAFTDIDGNPLNGTNTYTITFDNNPPVQAFWSITLYDIPRYYLVDNPINRYSIGDRTAGIQHADDGTLTVTVSHTEPGDPAARANWLPAPAGPFRLVFRLYIPGAAILDGSYQFPPITKA